MLESYRDGEKLESSAKCVLEVSTSLLKSCSLLEGPKASMKLLNVV